MADQKIEIRSERYSGDDAKSILSESYKTVGVSIKVEEFSRYFVEFAHSAFRFETLPSYAVAQEDKHFAAYVRGDSDPLFRFTDWERTIHDATSVGKKFQVVRVVPEPLTTYFCYELDWHYALYEKLGQDTRFIADAAVDGKLRPFLGADFWLFDDKVVVAIEYNQAGDVLDFRKIENSEDIERMRVARDLALATSRDFNDFISTYTPLIRGT